MLNLKINGAYAGGAVLQGISEVSSVISKIGLLGIAVNVVALNLIPREICDRGNNCYAINRHPTDPSMLEFALTGYVVSRVTKAMSDCAYAYSARLSNAKIEKNN